MKSIVGIQQLLLLGLFANLLGFNIIKSENIQKKYHPKSLADYNDFKTLVGEVEKHRAKRLISLDEFSS